MQIKINGKTFPLLASTAQQEEMSGHMREVVTLTMEATYQDAADNFVDGATFTIVEEVVGEDGSTTTVEYYHDEYPTPGAITDNRDGTVVVKMGAANTKEQDLENKVAVAEAETAKVSQDLVTLVGKSVSSDTDISALRLTFEAAADKLSDNDAKIAPSLTKAWTTNEAVVTGDRRYFAPNDSLYKSLQDHITSVNTFPDTATDYWVLL